ncbi:response regulator [Lyngbya sp. PCC 8106]|uniref:response regulator n=1 Tax=Lyngbya sp. (strain PCC 8106) TaxID=313612 RepID=UPI0000EA8AE0|nr:response regulator [Lyngbya sp. PCC 8106]EAW37168.1 two-component sensor histidine kinase [Lyngbya sp. PCC 8106]
MYREPLESDVILVVDDSLSDLQVLETALKKGGFSVFTAENGEKALQIAESVHPNLILMDVILDVINGFEICRHLKANPSLREIPVIFLTNLSETINKAEGFAVGGVDYLSKPIDENELLARVRTHLTVQQMQQHLAIQNRTLQQEIKSRLQVEHQLEQALNFQAVVEDITEKIRDSLDEEQILQTATAELAKVLGINRCQIELYNLDQTQATIAYEYSTGLPKCQGMIRELDDFPELYQQLQQKMSLQFTEKISLSSSQQSPQTCLACPIFESQEVVGTIGNLRLLKPCHEVFEDLEVQLVQQVATQCAITIRQTRLYQAAQKQVEELKKLNRIKDEFLKTISHELRTPMSSIKLATQTLEKFLEDESALQKSSTFRKVLDIFRQACKRHNQLVDDLISLCYLEAKAETMVFEWLDLDTWLPEIVQPFLERVHHQNQQLNLDISPELPLLKSDISILERIVRELLDNACKYTPVGEKITVSVQATDEIISLKVSNSGIEIPPDEQQRVFDQFYRIPHHDPWQHSGTGLGLTLVQKLVELLDASIELESSANLTQFLIKFPQERLETTPSYYSNSSYIIHCQSNSACPAQCKC